MDNRLKRFLSLALAIIMVIGMMPTNVVFATEIEGQDPALVAEDPQGSPAQEPPAQEPPAQEPPAQEPPAQDLAQVPAPIDEHTCDFTETVASEAATYEKAGSVTKKCSCGKTQTVRICADGCTIQGTREHTDCIIKCNKKDACIQTLGHSGLCVGAGEVVLITNASELNTALNGSETVKLSQNLTLKGTEAPVKIESGKTVTLDLNGHNIMLESGHKEKYALTNLGNLTVTGTGIVYGIYNGLANDKDNANNATLTISSGTFQANASDSYGILNYKTTTINNGVFEANGGAALGNMDGATMTIGVEGTSSIQVTGVYNEGNLEIVTGTFKSANGKNAVWSYNNAELTIAHGNFIKEQTADTTVATVRVSGGTAEISGGSFSNDADGPALEVTTTNATGVTIGATVIVDDGIVVGAGAKLNIKGGSFQDPDSNSFSAPANSETISITGGTFLDANAQSFAAQFATPNKIVLFKENNQTVEMTRPEDGEMDYVVAKRENGTLGYTTLEEAIAAGGTVDLVKDVTVSAPIQVKQNVTLNMNQNTITSAVAGGRVFKLVDGCTNFKIDGGYTAALGANEALTEGNANFVSTSETDYGVIDITVAAAVKVENCNIYFNTDSGAIIKGRDTGASNASLSLDNVNVTTNGLIFTNHEAKMTSVAVTGGKYVSTASAGFFVYVTESASFSGTTITAAAMGVEVEGKGNKNAKATFTGNTITITGPLNKEQAIANKVDGINLGGMGGYVVGFSDGVDAEIVSGTYGGTAYANNLIGLTTTGDNLVIMDGVFCGKITSRSASSKVSIRKGTFNRFEAWCENGGQMVISGGNFSHDPSAYLATYYEVVTQSIDETVVRYIVQRKVVDGQAPDSIDGVFDNNNITNSEANDVINALVGLINNTTVTLPQDAENMTLVIKPVDIKAEKITVNNTDKIVISEITYDVTPMIGTQPQTSTKSITFQLPVPREYINSYVHTAYVHHGEETTFYDFEDRAYIELTASDFSEYRIEFVDIDENNHVARIGNKGYGSVQAAVTAVKDGETIDLMERNVTAGVKYGNVKYVADTDKSFTIDGHDFLWSYDADDTENNAIITIENGAGTAKVNIVNMGFVRNAGNSLAGDDAMILVNGKGHVVDVQIKDSSFTGPSKDSEVIGIKLEGAHGSKKSDGTRANGILVDGCSGSSLRAFLVNNGGSGLVITGVTLEDKNNDTTPVVDVGFELGNVADVTVSNVKIVAANDQYGISLDGSHTDFRATFTNCEISAKLPVMVYNTSAHGRIYFTGNNTLTGDSGYWCILGDQAYIGQPSNVSAESLSTGLDARIIVEVTDSGLSGTGINDKYERQIEGGVKYYTVMPEGKLANAAVIDDVSKIDDSGIAMAINSLVASEDVVVKLYDKDGVIATGTLVNPGDLYKAELSDVFVGVSKSTSSWKTAWTTPEGCATYRHVPVKAKLFVDGRDVMEDFETKYAPVSLDQIPTKLWTDVEDVGNLTLTEGNTTTWKHTFAEALNDAPTTGGTIKLYDDNTAVLSAAGEVTDGKTVTVTTVDHNEDGSSEVTLDWSKGDLFVGRGENSSDNGTLIFDNAHIKAAGDKKGSKGLNISGERDQNGTTTGDGILEIKNGSVIEVDYLINRNEVLVTGTDTKLTLTNGFGVGGRLKSEVNGAEQDELATLNVENGATLHVMENNWKYGLGQEGRGKLNVDNATFIYDGDLYIEDEEGTGVNVSGTSTLKITNIFRDTEKKFGKAINIEDGATVLNSSVGGDIGLTANGTEAEKITITLKNTVPEENLRIGRVETTNANVIVEGVNNYGNLKVQKGELRTDVLSKINANKVTVDEADCPIVIDTTELDNGTAVRVIDQTHGTLNGLLNRVKTNQDTSYAVYGEVAYNGTANIGDVVVSKVDRGTVYFNPVYTNDFGSKEADGRYQGVNAFAKFINDTENGEKLVLPELPEGDNRTQTIVLKADNAETASYGKLISGKNLIVTTEGDTDKYAVINYIRNATGNLTIDETAKIKVLGESVASGADDKGGVFTLNGELLLIKRENNSSTFKVWTNSNTHGKLVVGTTGILNVENGDLVNEGEIEINGIVNAQAGVVNKSGLVIGETGKLTTTNSAIANTGSITVDYPGETDYECQIAAKQITGTGELTIDADKLNTINKIQVIELTDGVENDIKAMVSVKDEKAATWIDVEHGCDVYIYYEAYVKDKTISENNGFSAAKAYATVEKAIEKAAAGDTVVLLADAMTDSVVIDKNLTLDLNNHKITGAYPLYLASAANATTTVTVKNGTVETTTSTVATVKVAKDCVLVLDGATVSARGQGIALYKNAVATIGEGSTVSGKPAVYIYGGTLNVNGGTVAEIKGKGNAIVSSFNSNSEIVDNATVNISDGTITGKIVIEDAKNGVEIPENYTASLVITGGDFRNSGLDQDYVNKIYGSIAVSSSNTNDLTTFDTFVPYNMCAVDYICQKKANSDLYEVIYKPHGRVFLDTGFAVGSEVHFDGKPYTVQEGNVVILDADTAKKAQMFMTTYGIEKKGTAAVEDDYPVAMYVWYVKGMADANRNGIYDYYSVERVSTLDNFFKYEGTSIRVGDAKNGIRFFTSVDANKANMLMNGSLITSGSLNGAKMTGTGTVFKFKRNDTYVNRDNGVSSYVFGGAVGNTFRVFQQVGGRNWFTGVLTGLDSNPDVVDDLISTRPYAEIQIGGKTVVLYGGPLDRSIYYVAKQNQNTFPAGSAYDNFVENLIRMGS